MKFEPGQQLYVNNKWFFDILESKDGQLVCRIKYKEAPNRQYYLYKDVKIDEKLLSVDESNDIFIVCKIDEKKLKDLYGSLIDRILKEQNPYLFSVNEDASATVASTAGMGAVSQPGLSGTPGVPGTSGSGDLNVGNGVKNNKFTYTKSGTRLKKALIDLLSMKEDLSNYNPETDSDYKKLVYEFLDYPWTVDLEIQVVKEASKDRDVFSNTSTSRISEYFKDLYTLNKFAIDSNCSNEFINKLLLISKA